MNTSFGLRIVGITAMSIGIAIPLTIYQASVPDYLNNFDWTLINSTSWLAFYLILLGYYGFLRTPLKASVSLLTYALYVLGGILLTSISIFKALEVILSSSGVNLEATLFTLIIPLALAYLPPFLVYQFQKLKEHPTYRQWYLEGKGGSARWASVGTFDKLQGKLKQTLFTYWLNMKGVTTDGIYLGKTMFSDDPFRRHVVMREDCMNLTIGLTGAGKSVSVQNLTYSMYEGSIIGFDPKGELSLATANRRHHENIGGKGTTEKHFPNGLVHIADPFGLNAKYGFKSIHYDPLFAEVKEDLSNARTIASDVSDALFTPDDIGNAHFEENPRNIFEGYIIHVLSTYPKECHTLPFVYDLLRGVNPETGNVDFDFQKKVLLDMFKNKACGGLASNAASLLTDIGPNERGSMLSTMSRHLKWIGDENMRAHLQGSDFSFRDFGIKKTKVKGKEVEVIETLYIILPDPKIKEFMRYIRLMSTIAIRVMQTREEKPKISTLLIIDEFPRLGGKIEVIAEGFSILRSYGIKLWCFIQTYGQLLHDYPKQASSMVGNSTVQVFGVGMGDDETSEFVSKTLGSRIIRQYDRRKTVLGFSKKIVVNETARELLTPAEVTTKLGKSANMQIIFPNDGLPMRLERLAFKSLKMKKRKFRTIGLGGLKKQIE